MTNTGNLVSRAIIRFDKKPTPSAATEKPFDRFEDALRQVLSVPKSVVDARVREDNATRRAKD